MDSRAAGGHLVSPVAAGAESFDPNRPAQDERPRFQRLGEVLRFDLTRDWVYRNWARKSTGLGDPELFGVRVALVTGTGLADLAGSLTYYFNSAGEVQHIAFRGRTADPRMLVKFLVETYRLQQVQAPIGEQLFQVSRSGRAQSELRIRSEPVLRTTSPHGSYLVDLDLERPGSNRFLRRRPPQLEIPGVESAAEPNVGSQAAIEAEESGAAGSDQESAEPGLIGEFRPATPAEEAQVLWKRWPN